MLGLLLLMYTSAAGHGERVLLAVAFRILSAVFLSLSATPWLVPPMQPRLLKKKNETKRQKNETKTEGLGFKRMIWVFWNRCGTTCLLFQGWTAPAKRCLCLDGEQPQSPGCLWRESRHGDRVRQRGEKAGLLVVSPLHYWSTSLSLFLSLCCEAFFAGRCPQGWRCVGTWDKNKTGRRHD